MQYKKTLVIKVVLKSENPELDSPHVETCFAEKERRKNKKKS